MTKIIQKNIIKIKLSLNTYVIRLGIWAELLQYRREIMEYGLFIFGNKVFGLET